MAYYVYSGQSLSDYLVTYNQMYVYSGGKVTNTDLSVDGELEVYSGGSALAVTSNAGAVVIVSDGGHIEYA